MKTQDFESMVNDPFLKNILSNDGQSTSKPEIEIQKWTDRCKNEIILSAPRYDGYDIDGWLDECEGWLNKTSKNEKVKFSMCDICAFRDMMRDWVSEQYEKIA